MARSREAAPPRGARFGRANRPVCSRLSLTPACSPAPRRLVEALAELQREVLGSIVTIPRGMYNVQITTQGSSLGGAVTASAGPGPAQAPPVTASLSAGIAAAAMRATGAWAGSRRRLASAGGVPFYVADAQSRDAYLADVGTVEPSVDDQTFTVTHTIYAASLPDATQMQTAINSNRAQLDVGWKSMLQNTPAQVRGQGVGRQLGLAGPHLALRASGARATTLCPCARPRRLRRQRRLRRPRPAREARPPRWRPRRPSRPPRSSSCCRRWRGALW